MSLTSPTDNGLHETAGAGSSLRFHARIARRTACRRHKSLGSIKPSTAVYVARQFGRRGTASSLVRRVVVESTYLNLNRSQRRPLTLLRHPVPVVRNRRSIQKTRLFRFRSFQYAEAISYDERLLRSWRKAGRHAPHSVLIDLSGPGESAHCTSKSRLEFRCLGGIVRC